ncbi:MAG TPA: GNAT family N-acetyltransferase [Chitinophagaceae bacterium]|nr:GNAT family N-acetyltransferase [Chitinophagaceae bacterium]
MPRRINGYSSRWQVAGGNIFLQPATCYLQPVNFGKMNITATRVPLDSILFLRALFLNEINAQVRYNACHERGWSDSYIIKDQDQIIGYGSVKGNENREARDTVFEFYIIPTFRHLSNRAFAALLNSSRALFIECQSNDSLLSSMLYQFAENINAPVVLFEDNIATQLAPAEVSFRAREQEDIIFEHQFEPVGNCVLEKNKEVVATGGFFLHYNFPYADLFMEVKENYRKMGLGSFLVQELKKQCYLSGRVPAARCNAENSASRACLEKAGFRIAGHLLLGTVDLSQR